NGANQHQQKSHECHDDADNETHGKDRRKFVAGTDRNHEHGTARESQHNAASQYHQRLFPRRKALFSVRFAHITLHSKPPLTMENMSARESARRCARLRIPMSTTAYGIW